MPFAPVHLLFINLLTDSLPAIALGLEPDRSEVMSEKPRLADESILTKDFLSMFADISDICKFSCRAVSGSSNSRNDVCYHAKYFKNAICTFNWNFDRVYRIGSYLWSLYWLCRGKFSDLYGKSKTGSFIYYSFSAFAPDRR